MKTKQINITVGFKVPVAYGHVRYEVTEFVDLEEGDDRDAILREKRVEITQHVYDHVKKMRDRLDADMAAKEAAKPVHPEK